MHRQVCNEAFVSLKKKEKYLNFFFSSVGIISCVLQNSKRLLEYLDSSNLKIINCFVEELREELRIEVIVDS